MCMHVHVNVHKLYMYMCTYTCTCISVGKGKSEITNTRKRSNHSLTQTCTHTHVHAPHVTDNPSLLPAQVYFICKHHSTDKHWTVGSLKNTHTQSITLNKDSPVWERWVEGWWYWHAVICLLTYTCTLHIMCMYSMQQMNSDMQKEYRVQSAFE